MVDNSVNIKITKLHTLKGWNLSYVSCLLPMQKTQEMCFWSLGWEDPLEKKMATYPYILAWKSHGQRSLVGYSPKGPNELHATEHKCLEKCIVSLLTMLSIPSISAEPSTKRTMHKYLLLLTFKIKILNNNQIHGWEFSLGKSKRRQEGKRNMPKSFVFFFFFFFNWG